MVAEIRGIPTKSELQISNSEHQILNSGHVTTFCVCVFMCLCTIHKRYYNNILFVCMCLCVFVCVCMRPCVCMCMCACVV